MWDESELQHFVRARPEDILAEIETIEATAEQPAPIEIVATAIQPVASTPSSSLRLRSAIDAWFKRKAAYDADPNNYEATVARNLQEKNREHWRAEYKLRLGRDVRDYERDQTPERRAAKKAAKSKDERARRLVASTPEKVAADKEAARLRARKSRDAAKQRKAEAEQAGQAMLQDDPNFARF